MARKKTAAPARKSSGTIHLPAVTKPAAGAAAGAVVGAVAGPVGAIVGGVIGAVLGRRSQKGKPLLPRIGRSRKSTAPNKGAKEATAGKTTAKKTGKSKSSPAPAKTSSGSSARRGKASAKKSRS